MQIFLHADEIYMTANDTEKDELASKVIKLNNLEKNDLN